MEGEEDGIGGPSDLSAVLTEGGEAMEAEVAVVVVEEVSVSEATAVGGGGRIIFGGVGIISPGLGSEHRSGHSPGHIGLRKQLMLTGSDTRYI